MEHFPSFAMTCLGEDFHLQVGAPAGRTRLLRGTSPARYVEAAPYNEDPRLAPIGKLACHGGAR